MTDCRVAGKVVDTVVGKAGGTVVDTVVDHRVVHTAVDRVVDRVDHRMADHTAADTTADTTDHRHTETHSPSSQNGPPHSRASSPSCTSHSTPPPTRYDAARAPRPSPTFSLSEPRHRGCSPGPKCPCDDPAAAPAPRCPQGTAAWLEARRPSASGRSAWSRAAS